jgi:hypothetical protein
MSEPTLVVTRWKRYGKDRLYVTGPDGVKIGWWDLLTDEAHPTAPEHRDALTSAVQVWEAGKRTSTPEARTAPESETPPPPQPTPPTTAVAERPWVDLATNAPGAAAREQALSARDAAPVRNLLARAIGVHTDERAWRIGADGEERVAAQLAKVVKKDPRWRVIHAIPVGTRGADIDHLLIGPGGVFTTNAKHHPRAKIWVGGNTFLVNGVKQPYVRNSRHEATRAAELLSAACGFPVHVEGLVVTVNADDVVVKSQPDGVTVVPRMRTAKWLLRHGEILDVTTIETIFAVARRSTTWRP